MEPITVTKGLYFFRPQFLRELRDLADRLGIFISVDEIFTGGGRTGFFWATSHYPDFWPDIITFGKGLGVNGVAKVDRTHEVNNRLVKRWRWPVWSPWENGQAGEATYPETVLDNTSRVHPLALTMALHTLRRILHDDLPKEAGIVGKYALERMREKAKRLGFENDIHGIGLLFDVGSHTDELTSLKVNHYNGRWSPPLTTSKQEFDVLLGNLGN